MSERCLDYERSPDYARAGTLYTKDRGRGGYHDSEKVALLDGDHEDDQQVLRSPAAIQTAAHLARIQEFKDYLVMCEERQSITQSVHHLAWTMWERMNAISPGTLEVPDACPGSSGELLLTWDRDSDHFEIEIEAGRKVSLFYVNKDQKLSWELDATPDDTIDRRTEQVLQLFQISDFPTQALAAGSAL